MSDERADWILDAAGELLVAWGYRRVTIEDVARRAGIGKGTVYLHFKTKEMLFLTVVMREQVRLIDRFVAAFGADPSLALPSQLARLAYLWVHEDPIIHVIVTGDPETLGALVRSGADQLGPLMKTRRRTIAGYFAVMREHGVVRDDLAPEALLHAYTAILTGFLTVDPYHVDGEMPLEAKAELLAYTVRSSFEDPDAAGRVGRAVPQVIELYRNLRELLIEEISRRKLP
ncbi:TetR family transcriptional regulator [Sphaerisporangium melleum]|uniref:TetR family transcriptional regulator n=1 Tax=Sphaerisporangium melleum TaxID=321316 RepID=A0A917VLZ6_9ACTN|nr:TetR/AcrR family transcriptional regulator [Sphaerisporangium melleum]GGK97563.1 TetR family transcriptional regulator [Sphaerisporangium melleum]GII73641.1 TetR family transcriptional regulator [Sphaerisporangium melleum]